MAGFFRKAGQFLGNYGKASADIFTGGKAIKDSAYKGAGSNFFRKAGTIGGNVTTSIADTTLGTLGMGDVLTENAYSGENTDKWDKGAGIAGKVGQVGLQVAGNIIAPGIGGAIVSSAQNIGSGFNDQIVDGRSTGNDGFYGQQNNMYNEDYYRDPNYNPYYNYGIAGYKNGGIVGYADGGVTGTNLNPYIAGGTALLGLLQTGLGYRGLKKIQKEPIPQLGVTSQLRRAYDRAQSLANIGYTPQEEAAFKSNLAQAQNTAFRSAINQGGGNLAQTINAGLKSQNIGALNKFAAQDAALNRQNIRYADSFADKIQDIENRNMEAALSRRMAREQALGSAAQSGLQNLANSANMFGAYGYEAYKNNKFNKSKKNTDLLNNSYRKTLGSTAFNPLSDINNEGIYDLPKLG